MTEQRPAPISFRARPSASNAFAWMNCPAMPRLLEFARALPSKPSASMERGTRIHQLLATDILPDDATAEERGIVDAAKKIETTLLSDTFGDDYHEKLNVIRERRVYAEFKNGEESIGVSGQADACFSDGKKLLVIDYKTGERTQLAHSAVRYQLMTLCWLAANDIGVNGELIGAAIWVDERTSDVFTYDQTDAENAIRSALIATDPNQMHAGLWCSYCPCMHVCPRHSWWAVITSQLPGEVVNVELAAKVLVAKKIMDKLAESARTILNAQDETTLRRHGLKRVQRTETKLRDGAQAEAMSRLIDVIGDNAFDCVKIMSEAAAEKIAAVKAISKAKAKEEYKGLLGDLLEKATQEFITVDDEFWKL